MPKSRYYFLIFTEYVHLIEDKWPCNLDKILDFLIINSILLTYLICCVLQESKYVTIYGSSKSKNYRQIFNTHLFLDPSNRDKNTVHVSREGKRTWSV